MTLDWREAFRDLDIMVLGATGFIGRWVARSLTDASANLHLPVRDSASPDTVARTYGIRAEWIEADLTDLDATTALIQQRRPAIIFNLAGYGIDRAERDQQTAYRINADLVRRVAQTLSTSPDTPWPGQRFIHVGSGFEYGRARGDLSEATHPEPGTLYGQTKLAGTQACTKVCQQSGLRGLTARPFTVYGPGEHTGRLLPSLIQAANLQSSIPLTAGLQERDFTYVEDIAEGLLRLACSAADPGAVVNLATGRLSNVHDFSLAAGQVLGISEHRLGFGAIPTRPEEMKHDPVATTLLESLTSWRPPTTPLEGIRRTLAYQDRQRS